MLYPWLRPVLWLKLTCMTWDNKDVVNMGNTKKGSDNMGHDLSQYGTKLTLNFDNVASMYSDDSFIRTSLFQLDIFGITIFPDYWIAH